MRVTCSIQVVSKGPLQYHAPALSLDNAFALIGVAEKTRHSIRKSKALADCRGFVVLLSLLLKQLQVDAVGHGLHPGVVGVEVVA